MTLDVIVRRFPLTWVLLALLIPAMSHGSTGPHLISSCPTPNLPGDSSVFFHDRSCETIYVGPPQVGHLQVDRFLPTVIPQQCMIFERVLSGFQAAVDAAARSVNAAERGEKEAGQDSAVSLQQCNSADAQIESRDALLAQLGVEVRTLLEEQKALSEQILAVSGQDSNGDVLELLSLEFSNLRGVLSSKRAEMGLIARDLAPLKEWFEVSGCRARLDPPSETPVTEELLTALAVLAEASNQYMAYIQKNARISGATGVVEITVDFDSHLAKWKRRNPGKNVVPLSIQMKISGGTSFSDKQDIPALLQGEVVGLRDASGAILFGSAIAAEVVLNLPAACTAMRHGRDRSALREALEQGSMGLSGLVEYPVFVGTTYTVRVDHKALFQRIREETSRGGFFRTSRVAKVTEIDKSDEIIEVVFSTTDIEEESQREIIQAVKGAVIQRALDLINAEYLPDSDLTLTLDKRDPAAPKTAEFIRKNCANKWCQAGAALIDIGHAVFGRESELKSFLRKKNIQVVERYDSSRPIVRYTTISFSVE